MTRCLSSGWEAASFRDALEFLHVDLFAAPDVLYRDGEGFDRSQAFLADLGDPQDAVAVVHIAGTAGKGTVAYGISSVLQSAGMNVGLHVSPHVYDIRERFQVNGQLCTEHEFVALLNSLLPGVRWMASGPHGPPTFFELTVAMAFLHFKQKRCSLNVVETGLGGLYDTTNAVTRSDKLAVITRVGFDHEAVLGDSLDAIASQKAGILTKDGEAVVLHHGIPAIDDTIHQEAARRGCHLHLVRANYRPGDVRHLSENRALATKAVQILAQRHHFEENLGNTNKVLDEVRLPGRFEHVRTSSGRIAILDGAHNPMKIRALVAHLTKSGVGPTGWVFGCRRDKKAEAMLRLVSGLADELCLVQFPISSGDVPADVSTDAEELLALARRHDTGAWAARSLSEAAAFVNKERDTPVVVAGSFHLLSALRPLL